MVAFPEMECWTAEHVFYMVVGVIGIVVLYVWAAVFIFFVIRHIQKHKLHNDKR